MSGPTKEYRARINVKLTDDLLPSPVLSRSELENLMREALAAGAPESPIVAIYVDDPRG